nr:hypothetical protein [Kibdelosporangium sp. MJ126-NF4]CEL12771.1 hypothetical protein [Kibdelosporangium sp. MJ126-NF4]CTQ98457.1 hypothetical protein [Kibdelosporangium sp. MJ126-NF4]
MLELFIGGVIGVVPKLIGSWIETRNSLRVEYVKAHLNAVAEEQRLQTQIRLHEADLQHRSAQQYPLGTPGRLRALLPVSGLPTIVVSPTPPGSPRYMDGLDRRVRELLLNVADFRRYATIPSGVFAHDAGVTRFIDGEVGARVIAEAEFGRWPAILVYFEPGFRSLTAVAYLSTVFGDVDGSSGFPFPIATYQPGAGRSVSRDTDLPSWHHIDPTATPGVDPLDVVASTISWFVLSAVDTYWQLTSGVRPGLLARSGASSVAEVETPPAVDVAEQSSQLGRLESEAQRLVRLGFDITLEQLPGGYVGLHLSGPKDVVVVVDESYPELPPVVIRIDNTDVHIGAADWTAECGLADIVEAAT